MKHLMLDETETIHINNLTENNFIIALRGDEIVATISKKSNGYKAFTDSRDTYEKWGNLIGLLEDAKLLDCELLVYEIRP